MCHFVLIEKNARPFPWDVGPIINKSVLYTIRTSYHIHGMFQMHHLTKHMGKLSTLQHIINLITFWLTLTPTSFLKETWFFWRWENEI